MNEPTKLNREEQAELIEALQVAFYKCHEKGLSVEIWREMLYEAKLGFLPKDFFRMRNLLRLTLGFEPFQSKRLQAEHDELESSCNENATLSDEAPPVLARTEKASGRTSVMYDHGKSDKPIVPEKSSNKSTLAIGKDTETMEERGLTKGNTLQANTSWTQSQNDFVSNGLERVRQVAVRDKKVQFTSLLHHITPSLLSVVFEKIKVNAAPGIDGMTWNEYAKQKWRNLKDLHQRIHRGGYRAKPSRRVLIPKPDERQRPLGISSLEDKIAQGAVVEILSTIYEQDFLGFSYGFRPNRSTHMALDALAVGLQRKRVSWVLDADIRGFFDAIDHEWMLRFIQHRIRDKRILRLIKKWLKVGVLEDGEKIEGQVGTPQGAAISPLLANIYLHYVFDLWANNWRNQNAKGDVIIIRYADDFVVGFQHENDAINFLEDLKARMKRFSLELHHEKTRLIEFGRFARENRKRRGLKKPETFTFLGFTHICGTSRRGWFLLFRHTDKKRMRRTLQSVKESLRKRMHDPIPNQGAWLRRVLQGYFGYYAVPTNAHAIDEFKTQVSCYWLRSLRRRSHKNKLTWSRMNQLIRRWLPRARILHPWPSDRFDATTRGRSPVR